MGYIKLETWQLVRKGLNNDGPQFYQYQQNEQSSLLPHTIEHKETMTYDVGKSVGAFFVLMMACETDANNRGAHQLYYQAMGDWC
jgi:hypothetical protein